MVRMREIKMTVRKVSLEFVDEEESVLKGRSKAVVDMCGSSSAPPAIWVDFWLVGKRLRDSESMTFKNICDEWAGKKSKFGNLGFGLWWKTGNFERIKDARDPRMNIWGSIF